MEKFFRNSMALFAMLLSMGLGFTSCSSNDNEGEPQPVQSELDNAIKSMSGLVALDNNTLGNWDEGYISGDGYILARNLRNEATMAKSFSRAAVSENDIPCISYMTVDKATVVHVLFAEDGLPSQIIIGDNTLMFNFLNNEVLELVLSTPYGYAYQTTVSYNRQALLEAIANQNFEFFFQTRLAIIVALIENADIPSQFKSLVETFRLICEKVLAENPDATLADLIKKGLINEAGQAGFVDKIDDSFIVVVVNVKYSIMLWTGQASFKVGGTSCTLSGTIHCASPDFNTYGTYGIVCDTDKEKLNIDEAEYSGRGYQEGISTHFDVDFRGLKANTTYYYRAYYRFNTSNHGDLNFKYGDQDADIAYDTVIKEFTTGDNILSVDVVMCIDVTGSMSNIINTVKYNAMGFYDAFNNKCIENGIQLSELNNKVIAFRDINVDGAYWWEESPYYSLPEQRSEFNAFVNGLYATGGGDAPESGLEALNGAFNAIKDATDDGYHRQVIILWSDVSFLSSPAYTSLSVDELASQWSSLSTGRRLIIFAPNGTCETYDTGYEVFDGWKNVIHSTSISTSFSDFDYILENIIGELIGRGNNVAPKVPKRGLSSIPFSINN